jgi:hypothetical protein
MPRTPRARWPRPAHEAGGVVGEEISTRGGHLIALFIEKRIRPWGSLRDAVRQVHEQGGLAIVAHPLVPYPITSASGRSIRSLLADPDRALHPDGIEAFNPTVAGTRWEPGRPRFVEEMGVAAVASSDSHRARTSARHSPCSRAPLPRICGAPSRVDRRPGTAASTPGPGRCRRSAPAWQVRPWDPRQRAWQGPSGRHGPRPRLSGRPRATAATAPR